MSKLVVTCVFDVAAQYYQPPLCFRATGAALRWFEDAIKDPQSGPMHGHPDQFQLFHVADFDDFTGGFIPISSPILLVHGSAFSSP